MKDQKEYHFQKSISYETAYAMLKFFYTGKCLITDDNVSKMLTISDKYKVTELRNACFDFIVKTLDEESVTDMLMKARRKEFDFDCTELMAKCIEVISKKTEGVFKSEQFYEFDEDIIISLCKSDKICVDELDLFNAVLKWGKRRCKDQEAHSDLPEVLKNIIPHIRYTLMTAEELIKYVKPLKFVPYQLYEQALEYIGSPEHFKDAQGEQFRDRGKVLQGSTLLTTKYISILLNWLKSTKSKNKHWKLCYKASKDVSMIMRIF